MLCRLQSYALVKLCGVVVLLHYKLKTNIKPVSLLTQTVARKKSSSISKAGIYHSCSADPTIVNLWNNSMDFYNYICIQLLNIETVYLCSCWLPQHADCHLHSQIKLSMQQSLLSSAAEWRNWGPIWIAAWELLHSAQSQWARDWPYRGIAVGKY